MHFLEQRSCAWWLLWAAAREPRAGPGDGVAPKLHSSLSTSPGITQGEITDFTASEHAENNPKSTMQPPGSICPLLELPMTPGFHPPPAQGSPAVGVLQMFPNKRGSEEKKKHPKATQGKAASFRSAGQRGGLWCTNSVSRYQ